MVHQGPGWEQVGPIRTSGQGQPYLGTAMLGLIHYSHSSWRDLLNCTAFRFFLNPPLPALLPDHPPTPPPHVPFLPTLGRFCCMACKIKKVGQALAQLHLRFEALITLLILSPALRCSEHT